MYRLSVHLLPHLCYLCQIAAIGPVYNIDKAHGASGAARTVGRVAGAASKLVNASAKADAFILSAMYAVLCCRRVCHTLVCHFPSLAPRGRLFWPGVAILCTRVTRVTHSLHKLDPLPSTTSPSGL